MRIQVNSDSSIAVDNRITGFVADEVNRVLSRFTDKLTRVEVHLTDVNSHKFGLTDKRCMIEARPARHQPLTVTSGARTVKQSVGGALAKMRRALQTFFDRLGSGQRKTKAGAVKRAQSPVTRTERRAPKEISSKAVSIERSKRAASGTVKVSSAGTKKRTSLQDAGSGRSPKKKGIYQARRKSWPSR
jgi:hypothetical protein